jgi:hypothetical protein
MLRDGSGGTDAKLSVSGDEGLTTLTQEQAMVEVCGGHGGGLSTKELLGMISADRV